MNNKIEIKLLPKSTYVPLIYQPIYKVVQILAILTYNTGSSNSASITHLHFMAWALRSKSNEQVIIDYSSGKRNNVVPWCFEPALDKAVIMVIINEYCTRLSGGKIKLTAKGKKLIKDVEVNKLFKNMINVLSNIGVVKESEDVFNNWEIL